MCGICAQFSDKKEKKDKTRYRQFEINALRGSKSKVIHKVNQEKQHNPK